MRMSEDVIMSGCMEKRGRPRSLTDSARKRRRSEANAQNNKNRIYLGCQYDRWIAVKGEINAENNSEVAKFLIDRYEEQKTNKTAHATIIVSTPGRTPCTTKALSESEISQITSSDQEPHYIESEMSGVEDLHGLRSDKKLNMDKSSSFINPFELTIDISENAEMSYQSSDDEYVPSFDITLQPNTTVNIEEEEDEGADMNEKDGSDEPAVDMGPGIRRIDATNIDGFMSDRPYLVYMDCLLKLAHTNVRQTCTLSDCHSEVTLKTDNVGSALYLTWVCKNGHVQNKWCSQPLLNRRLHTGDLLLASATVLSGNNFQKIDLFAKVLGLPILSSSTFFKIQRTYIVPSVDHHWTSHLDSVLEEFRGKEVVVFGDGRMDSPGHSAQYCSYTFMEMETKKILSIVTMDKRMTGGKSTNLEKACFEKGLHSLLDAGVNVVEVVTDAHPQIGALMKKPQYRNIKHLLDIWHGTKNIGKKIIQVAQEKGKKNKQLFDWTKDIVNHYWHCASISTTVEEFKGHWIGILHHVVNEHQWILSYSDDFENNKCNHGPLPAESSKSYLEKGSDAHIALRGIVLNTRLLNSIHYYLNCRSTADLEIFQNEILAYA